ncbi:MAG: VWA domain-containing protein [Phycisphaerales bacterium]|nr:VWA domain-containing protein [Phycisphaerales bacterium]
MTFVTPMMGILTAGIIVPLLLLLYFLRLRRRPLRMSSTFLWDRAVEDLHANTPFQRLRPTALLLLQLLALLLVALAIMQPQIEGGSAADGRHVLLIDRSASMTATDVDGRSRLDEAKRQAVDRIAQLHGAGLFSARGGETMVIAFGDTAEVVAPFTDSRGQLDRAIGSIEPTHGRSAIADAMKLARAYLTRVDPEKGGLPESESAAIELFSDGRITDLSQQALRGGESLAYHRIGEVDTTNVSIAALAAERSSQDSGEVQVFASLANHDSEDRVVDIELSVDGIPVGLQEVSILPAVDGVAGKASVVFVPIDMPVGGIVRLHVDARDAMVIDDEAHLVIPPPKQLRVIVAEDGANVVETALEGLPLAELRAVSPSQMRDMVEADGLSNFDVVVSRGVPLPALPPGNYLIFGSPPPPIVSYAKGKPQVMVVADEEHPVMRFVEFSEIVAMKGHAVAPRPDDGVSVLLEGSLWPAIMKVDRGGVHAVYVAFDPLDSNWPYLRSFPFFIYNAIEYLGQRGTAVTTAPRNTGDMITMNVPRGTQWATVTEPGGRSYRVPVDEAGHIGWGPIRLSGLHGVSWGDSPRVEVAVHVPPSESELGAVATIEIGAEEVVATAGGGRAYVPLWPWAVGSVLVVLLIEWWFYQRKVA